jgi:hypothetical protein
MGVSEGIAGSGAIPCETNLDPRNPADRCEPAELVILEGTLGPVQSWMCPECQVLFQAHGYSVVPFLDATKIAN